MRGSKINVMLAALAGSLFGSEVMAQGRWDLPTGGGWAPPRCISTHAIYLPFECGDYDMFLKARTEVPGDLYKKCCGAINFTTGGSVTIGANSEFSACGAKWNLKVEGTYSYTSTEVYDRHVPCGCVQLYYEQPYRVRKQKTHYVRCYTTGAPSRPWETVEWTEVVILKDKVPNTGSVEPYYYQNTPPGCPSCTNGRPNNPDQPAPPAWDPTIPGGFPREMPNARPAPDAIPWDPATHGPPDFDAAMAPNGADKQVTIDLLSAWKARQITSVLELNLFETGWILQSIERLRLNNGAGDATSVEVLVADGVGFNGTIFAVSKQLYKYADAMVNAKMYGDFNEDGVRNSVDLQLLQGAVIDLPDMKALRLYDVNGDNDVNESDMIKWLELVGT